MCPAPAGGAQLLPPAWLVSIPTARATLDASAPGAGDTATIRSFSARATGSFPCNQRLRIPLSVAEERIEPPTEQSDSGSAATVPRGDGPEPIIRFARPNILFYDEHVIDLYYRISALYRMGEDTKAKSHSNPDRENVTRDRFCSGPSSREDIGK
jgi:hypothetical protein